MGIPWDAHGQPTRAATGSPRAPNGLSVGSPWDAHGMPTDRPRASHGHSTNSPREAHGQPTDNLRAAHGKLSPWGAYGLSVGCPWDARAVPMGCPWAARGLLVGCPWASWGALSTKKQESCTKLDFLFENGRGLLYDNVNESLPASLISYPLHQRALSHCLLS